MASFWEGLGETITEGGIGPGLLVGVGVLLALPVVRPVLRVGAKMAIKGGIGLYQWGTQAVADAQEAVSGLAAEARQNASVTELDKPRATQSSR